MGHRVREERHAIADDERPDHTAKAADQENGEQRAQLVAVPAQWLGPALEKWDFEGSENDWHLWSVESGLVGWVEALRNPPPGVATFMVGCAKPPPTLRNC